MRLLDTTSGGGALAGCDATDDVSDRVGKGIASVRDGSTCAHGWLFELTSLGSELLARSLASSRLAGGLLGASHGCWRLYRWMR